MCIQKIKEYFGFGDKRVPVQPAPSNPIPVPVTREVLVSTTTIKRSENDHRFYWHTQTANGDIVADSGQGYGTVEDAINGFLAGQGHSDWTPGTPLPFSYRLIPETPNHYTIQKLAIS